MKINLLSTKKKTIEVSFAKFKNFTFKQYYIENSRLGGKYCRCSQDQDLHRLQIQLFSTVALKILDEKQRFMTQWKVYHTNGYIKEPAIAAMHGPQSLVRFGI